MFHGNVSLEIAEGLKTLKQRIEAANIPPSKIDETINIATWNIRELGKKRRSEAAIHYIAEIIGQFDLVSIVELRDNLGDLQRILPILGPYWDIIYSDAILDDGGNRERICYVFDQRAVTFNGLAAEASTPRTKRGREYLSDINWWRPPYIASFKSGNFDFCSLTTHVRWGDSEEGRLVEIQALADWLEAKIGEPNCEDKDIIVMGDFNIPSRTSPLFAAITSKGLVLPSALAKDEFGSNLARDKRYDQILHFARYGENFARSGGVLDFYKSDHKPLFPDLTKTQFTYQLSDHLPLWLQINTDIDGLMLDQLIQRKRQD
ncbi:endonuclease/exonuclease/phosphatase family protein [Sinorhizobium sp. BG8]|uniref:endonuclease/exonuclease/phosphatase family protein n=1 Tax=Sinorhizobium sp. BG8 TaxID=2613773 RepID=UPI00193CFEB7|nr:endonuclease/exonuclease/phosphatase family protein [Sinorhizobium sp. BG8]QRM54890.1 endonuclease/exonuclease/phosphatase family protein [Sinorhizobium sp. BG8]